MIRTQKLHLSNPSRPIPSRSAARLLRNTNTRSALSSTQLNLRTRLQRTGCEVQRRVEASEISLLYISILNLLPVSDSSAAIRFPNGIPHPQALQCLSCTHPPHPTPNPHPPDHQPYP